MFVENNIILDKSKAFALRIIKLYKYLCDVKKEYIMSKQIMRSGTSVGANVKEGVHAQTKPDFYAKMYIAYKETAVILKPTLLRVCILTAKSLSRSLHQ